MIQSSVLKLTFFLNNEYSFEKIYASILDTALAIIDGSLNHDV